MVVNKRYRSAFVVEKSKLTRFLTVLAEKFAERPLPCTQSFEAHLAGLKTVTSDTITQVLDLDNSERSRIERLVILYRAASEQDEEPQDIVQVDFDGHRPVDVTIDIVSNDNKWASETVSVVEEQVERMLQRGPINQLFANSELSFALLAIFLLLLLLLLLGMFTIGLPFFAGLDSRISKTMWLSATDISELRKALDQTPVLPADRMSDVLSRQLRNIIAEQTKSPLASLRDWRIFVIGLPIVILMAAFIYLATCYPAAVFLWGDAEEWYRRLVSRRNVVWTVIIAALILGIVANLAVFAFGSLVASTTP